MDKRSPAAGKIRFDRRIQTRLIVGLLLLAVVPLALLGPYAYRKVEQGYETQVGQTMQGVATLVKGQVDDAFSTADRQVAAWTRQADAQIAPTVAGDGMNIFQLLQNRFRNFLKGQREIVPIFSEILCVKPAANGASQAQVLYSTNPAHESHAILDGFWVEQDGKFQVAPQFVWHAEPGSIQPIRSPFDPAAMVVPIVRAYQDSNGNAVALIGLIDVAQIQQLIGSSALGDLSLADLAQRQDTYALVTQHNGAVIAGLFPQSAFPGKTADSLLKQLAGAKQGRMEIAGVGNTFVGRSDFGRNGWQVLSLRNGDLAMAPVKHLGTTLLAAIVLLLCVVVVFSVQIAKRITGPVRDLVSATRVASSGDLSQTIEVRTEDEIGALARCFNHMVAELRSSFSTLAHQNEELKRLDRLKSEFLANTSHELRTPLNGIIGLLDMVLVGAFGEIEANPRARLALALTSANRLKKLINDMLDFSAGESRGEALLSRQNVDIERLIKEQAAPQFEGINFTKNIELIIDFPAGDFHIYGDADKLRQVFVNLLGNAFKFTNTGSITIHAAAIPNQSGLVGYVQCEIRDTGIGIPEHLLERIFDVFFQVEGGADRKYEGTGLGLAIAKKIVEQHGGEIWAESTVGEGTTVFVKLPTRPESMLAPSETRKPVVKAIEASAAASIASHLPAVDQPEDSALSGAQARQGEGETILVIDDEPINVEVLRAQLQFHNYQVVGVHSGQAGLDYLERCVALPDLILLDVMMPEMSGYEFCKRLKENSAHRNIPIIMVSAKSQVTDRIYALNLGALDYVVKPFEKAELLARLRVQLDLQRLRRDLEKFSADLEEKVNERTADLEKARAKAVSLAMRDTLTGLPNRNLFQDRLSHIFQRNQRAEGNYFAVAFADIDNFKVINDSLGHDMGDKLLVGFGERLQSCMRSVDTVARFGGDEFTLLLAGMKQPGDVNFVMKRIYHALREPFVIGTHAVHVSASIGVALNNSEYTSFSDLLRDADTAMYQAKANGKAQYRLFDKGMRIAVTERFRMESELRLAIQRKEFIVHYQPVISLETGAPVGFEALIRWLHPERGLIPPNQFLGLAEETGLIAPIGQWIIEESCRQLGVWSKSKSLKTSPLVTINVSACQFKDLNLVNHVLGAISSNGISSNKIKLEITESSLIGDMNMASELLLKFKALNIGLLLDDFGTGYSSLSYLSRLPFEGLKIDMSFVKSMLEDTKQANIVRAAIAIGRSLGLTVTAEGVETAEQLRFLRAEGCQFAQGYYFSEPIDAAAATLFLAQEEPGWIKNWSTRSH